MATQYTDYPVSVNQPFAWSWAGIFAGTFVFLAIETTFGVLGAAIFASASNPSVSAPTGSGTTIGLQIWMVILSIIAFYFAGKTSSKLLRGTVDRNLGMYHGMVTFGMSIFATLLTLAIALGGGTMTYTDAAGLPHMHPFNTAGYIASGGEWWLFVALILSMIAAAAGGIHGVKALPRERKLAIPVSAKPAA